VLHPQVFIYLGAFFLRGGSGSEGLLANLRDILWIPITQASCAARWWFHGVVSCLLYAASAGQGAVRHAVACSWRLGKTQQRVFCRDNCRGMPVMPPATDKTW
jgi:hypothetical protein